MIDTQYIKDRIKLSDVIGQYVKLRPLGGGNGRWTGKCCFHDDSNPSFDCDDVRGTYKCYGCSAGGDVFAFIQAIENTDFKSALTQAKVLAGIEDEYLTPAQRKLHELKLKQQAEERSRFKRWRDQITLNLKLYISAQWKIYRTAKRQQMIASTEELECQSETAYNEAIRKEAALEELESLGETDLMAYFKTQKSWLGIRNPGWCLSEKKIALAKQTGV